MSFLQAFGVKLVTPAILNELSAGAKVRPRLRLNLDLHPTLADPVQRFINALELGTFVRPHRHAREDAWEMFVVLRGRAAVLLFGDDGCVLARHELALDGANQAIEIPSGQWHGLVCLEADTVLFELKRGPYVATEDKGFATWAPLESDIDAAKFVAWYERAQPGDTPPARSKLSPVPAP